MSEKESIVELAKELHLKQRHKATEDRLLNWLCDCLQVSIRIHETEWYENHKAE